jgi:hypothetical protein
MLSLPQDPSTVVDGSDDDHPLILEDVKLDDMKLFIRAAMKSE